MHFERAWPVPAWLVLGLVVCLAWAGSAVAGAPVGYPFAVGDLDVDTANPSVAYNSLGEEYLVVWYNDRTYDDDVHGQLVSRDGMLRGPRRAITSGQGSERRYPDVAYNANWDEYLVVWEHYEASSGTYSIRAQRVDRDGQPTGGEIFVSAAGPWSGWRPRVAYAFTSGVYLVVWENHTQGNVSNDIVAQLVSDNGSLVGNNFVVAEGTLQFSHAIPDLAYNRQMNEFLVAWQQEDKNAGLYDVFARIVHPDASMPPGTIEISRYAVNSTRPAVGAIPTVGNHGQYLVAWELQYAPDDKDVMARLVDGDGTPAPSDFYLTPVPENQIEPAVAGNERSNIYLVTWTEDLGWSNIHAREVTIVGTLPEPERILAGKYAHHPAVVDGHGGDFLVAYDDQPYTPNRDIWGYLWGNRVYLPLVVRNP